MSELPVWKTCRCGQDIVVMPTKRGRRIAVNRHPRGDDAYKFRAVVRLDSMYVYGEHQPHFLTCTKPYPRRHNNGQSKSRYGDRGRRP